MRKKHEFHKYELSERVIGQLKSLGFRKPTPVQEKVIPLFIQKRNLIVEAPTGTGKTAAYGLPLISRLDLLKRTTQALVILPTRELAIQVTNALRSFYEGDKLKVGIVVGGTSMQQSAATIKDAPHILVTVPGRLKDVMFQQKYDFLWKDIKFLIVDEADKLMETGFQRDFDDIRKRVRENIQVGFFSATISEDSEELIRERFSRIKTIRLEPKEMLRSIRFRFVEVPEGKRELYLASLIEEENIKSALIFCGKRDDIFSVNGFLRNCGYTAESYYGTQSQAERANILNRFKEGHLRFLVASDLAARGLDIEKLPAVINLSIPQEYDFYLHRVGRTGRAGRRGKVYNLVLSHFEKAYLKNHHREIGLPVKPLKLDQISLPEIKDEKWAKYHLSRGKQDKIRKGDIVGYLLNHTDMDADKIGTITIYDSYSIVDMPEQAISQLEALDPIPTIKGKTVKIRKYKLDEQARRAKAVKKLLKDRKSTVAQEKENDPSSFKRKKVAKRSRKK